MPTTRPRHIERVVAERSRIITRRIGEDAAGARQELGLSKAAVAAAAGIDRAFLGRIEAGMAHPSIETLVALGAALGGEVSFRLYRGTGPRIADRWQASMVEGLLAVLDDIWSPHLEVPVWRPVRGVIDLVLERSSQPLLVGSEVQSTLGRIEQQVRWMAQKVEAIASSALVGDRPCPPTSQLLVLRSTDTTRTLAREFGRTFAAAYPARTADAVAALRDGAAWPAPAIVWMRIDGGVAQLLDGPPRGVLLGR